MLQKYLWQFCLLGAGVAVGSTAVAQAPVKGSPTPLSNTGGYAGNELRSIYRSSVGTGYSADSINKRSLQTARPQVPNVGQSSAPGSRLDLGVGGGRIASKPFSNYSPAPTVSPYLNLFREDLDGNSDFNYQTLVQPMLRQQQVNQQLQRESAAITQRLQSLAAQSDYNPQGSETQAPTGHQTTFMYYGHYYPALNQRRR